MTLTFHTEQVHELLLGRSKAQELVHRHLPCFRRLVLEVELEGRRTKSIRLRRVRLQLSVGHSSGDVFFSFPLFLVSILCLAIRHLLIRNGCNIVRHIRRHIFVLRRPVPRSGGRSVSGALIFCLFSSSSHFQFNFKIINLLFSIMPVL